MLKKNTKFFALSLIGATILTPVWSPAIAQVGSGTVMETIVVTARKKSEDLQDVPLAITAYTGQSLQEAGVNDLRGLSNITAGLQIIDGGAETITAPTIRGLAQSNTNGENNVSTFIDGVYIFNNAAINLNFADLERIEVVKGPVSALYGRNSFAGVINYVTRKPGDEFEGNVLGTIGSDNRYSINAAVGGPIIEDKLAARVSVIADTFGGTWEDPVNGTDMGGYDKLGVQLTWDANPSEILNIAGAFYYGNDGFDSVARPRLASNCAFRFGANQTYCGEFPQGEDNPPENPGDKFGLDLDPNDREVFHANVRTEIDFDVLTLSVLLGYNDISTNSLVTFDNLRDGLTYNLTPGPGTIDLNSYVGGSADDEDFSAEIRLSSRQDQPFRWTAGGFYYDRETTNTNLLTLISDPLPEGQTVGGFFPTIALAPSSGPFRTGEDELTARQISGFLGLEFDVNDQFTISGEGRFTSEKKSIDNIVGLVPQVDTDGPGLEETFDFWDFRFTADYQIAPDFMVYASVGSGTKAGGFNTNSTFADDISFDPERNITYEAGFKATLLDQRLRLNVAAFYIDWTDLQIFGIPSDPNNLGTVIKNFGEASAPGFEVEFAAQITDWLAWGGGIAYTDPEFGANAFNSASVANCRVIESCADSIVTVEGRDLIDLEGFSLLRQSNWQFNTNVDVNGRLSQDLDWFGRADYSYSSRQFGQTDNFAYWGDRHLVNLRAGIRNDRYTVTLWAENVLDDTTPAFPGTALNLNDFSTSVQPVLIARRTFGATFAANF